MKFCAFLCALLLTVSLNAASYGPLKTRADSSFSTATVAGAQEKVRDEFKENIETAETFYAQFFKKTVVSDSQKVLSDWGEIFYEKKPMRFMLKMPEEQALIENGLMKRYIKKYNEIYVSVWEGGNPVFKYLDIPTGDTSAVTPVTEFSNEEREQVPYKILNFKTEDEDVQICYDTTTHMIKKISVANPLARTETEIVKYVKNGRLKKGVFSLPKKARVVDLRK